MIPATGRLGEGFCEVVTLSELTLLPSVEALHGPEVAHYARPHFGGASAVRAFGVLAGDVAVVCADGERRRDSDVRQAEGF